MTALADTSVFIAREQGRALTAPPPDDIAVSVVTVAELHLGVLMAGDIDRRALRLATLRLAEQLEPLPVDETVTPGMGSTGGTAACLGTPDARQRLMDRRHRTRRAMPVVTQDADYDNVPGLRVVRV